MNQLNTTKRAQIIAALIEGNSINATCRMLGLGKHTVLRLLEDAGCACAAYHDVMVRGLRVSRAQCDEVWSFVYAKQKNVTMEQMGKGAGDCWTWSAIDADTKLIISYMLGIVAHLRRRLSCWKCFAHQQPHSANDGWTSRLCRCGGERLRVGHRLCDAG